MKWKLMLVMVMAALLSGCAARRNAMRIGIHTVHVANQDAKVTCSTGYWLLDLDNGKMWCEGKQQGKVEGYSVKKR